LIHCGSFAHVWNIAARQRAPDPYAIRMMSAADRKGAAATFQIADDIRSTLRWSECKPHLVGSLDTVSSVGWIENAHKLLYTGSNPDIAIGRHAVLDFPNGRLSRKPVCAAPMKMCCHFRHSAPAESGCQCSRLFVAGTPPGHDGDRDRLKFPLRVLKPIPRPIISYDSFKRENERTQKKRRMHDQTPWAKFIYFKSTQGRIECSIIGVRAHKLPTGFSACV
jgi:uncharacterized protein (DUF2235 family)